MEFLRIQRLCLHSIGFSLKRNEKEALKVYSLFNWLSILIIIIPEAHFVVVNSTDIQLATEALCPLLTCIIAAGKLMTFYFKRDTIYGVIEELDDMWQKCLTSDHPILEQGHKIDKRLTFGYLCSAGCAGVLYLLFPILKGIYGLQTTGMGEWIMPMRSIFIYDISVSPNYELTFLWFVHGTYLAVIGSVGVDCLFYGSALNISSHFQIIQKKVRNFDFDRLTAEQYTPGVKKVATEEFLGVIEYHQNILNICKEFEKMYSTILFSQFLITSVQLCVIAFQLTLPNQDPVKMATFICFLMAICFQLFTYCHAGTQLTTQSVTVSVAVYDSDWYKGTLLAKKLIAFILMRSQKSVIMSSGFYDASLETFNTILRAAGSYIAILQSLSEE